MQGGVAPSLLGWAGRALRVPARRVPVRKCRLLTAVLPRLQVSSGLGAGQARGLRCPPDTTARGPAAFLPGPARVRVRMCGQGYGRVCGPGLRVTSGSALGHSPPWGSAPGVPAPPWASEGSPTSTRPRKPRP